MFCSLQKMLCLMKLKLSLERYVLLQQPPGRLAPECPN